MAGLKSVTRMIGEIGNIRMNLSL
jgi:hypothetical protein